MLSEKTEAQKDEVKLPEVTNHTNHRAYSNFRFY